MNEPREWQLFDAEGKVLGRMATDIATVLRGKHRPTFRPHEDTGDVVVVINTDQVVVTGTKRETKQYHWHSGWPGGLKQESLGDLLERDSREVIRRAVYGMLPKNKLRDKMITRLKLYKGSTHPHTGAQFKNL